MIDPEQHFIPRTKLQKLVKATISDKCDREFIIALQFFSEKFVSDIVNRSNIIAKHAGRQKFNLC